MVAIFGLMRTEATPASLRAFKACEPMCGILSVFAHQQASLVIFSGFAQNATMRIRIAVKTTLTRIIKFSSLSNCQSTRSNNQHFLHIHQIAGSCNCPAVQVVLRVWCFLALNLPRSRYGEVSEVLGSIVVGNCLW